MFTKQLHMLWPETRLDKPPPIRPAAGYRLRQYRTDDKQAYLGLMRDAGFDTFSEAMLADAMTRTLPDGFFVLEHLTDNALAATTMATHNAKHLHPYGGELGWVAAAPDHRGHGLGATACAATVDRFIRAGYRRIYLMTDDHRLSAIRIYLKLGFVPFLYETDMEDRWQSICHLLPWPFKPERWPGMGAI